MRPSLKPPYLSSIPTYSLSPNTFRYAGLIMRRSSKFSSSLRGTGR